MKEPKGIAFFNIKSGDTHYCRLEPTIAAYINSSDMGINASRGQDFGWRLAPEWVAQVRDFKKDESKMQLLMAKYGGQKPSTTQILYSIYGEQMRAYEQAMEDEDSPFEEEYLAKIGGRKAVSIEDDEPADNFDQVAEQDEPTPAPEEPGAPEPKPEKPAKKK